MLNEFAYLIAYLGILVAACIPISLISWLIVRAIPDETIGRMRTGKPLITRTIKVDKRVYRLHKLRRTI